jgi:hypothetical protein
MTKHIKGKLEKETKSDHFLQNKFKIHCNFENDTIWILNSNAEFIWGVQKIISCILSESDNRKDTIFFRNKVTNNLHKWSSISSIHTFVNIPVLLLKNTLCFLIRAGILTKVWIGAIRLNITLYPFLTRVWRKKVWFHFLKKCIKRNTAFEYSIQWLINNRWM